MKTGPKALLFMAAAVLFCPAARAAESRTGADFLNIGIGARAIGMGSAYTAIANDVTALYWNPGGLSLLKQKELALMHSEWLLGSKYDFAGFGLPTSHGNWAAGISRLSQPKLEGRSEARTATGDISSYDQAFNVGFGRAITDQSGLGLNVKFIQSQIGTDSASTFALDLGGQYRLDRLPLGFGLAVQNMGPGLKFISQRDPLPLSVVAGVSWRVMPGLSLALDVKEHVHNEKFDFSFGSEYQMLPLMTFRAGYLAHLASGSQGSNELSGLGAGFGLKLFKHQLDYAVTPFGELGNAHRISFNIRF